MPASCRVIASRAGLATCLAKPDSNRRPAFPRSLEFRVRTLTETIRRHIGPRAAAVSAEGRPPGKNGPMMSRAPSPARSSSWPKAWPKTPGRVTSPCSDLQATPAQASLLPPSSNHGRRQSQGCCPTGRPAAASLAATSATSLPNSPS